MRVGCVRARTRIARALSSSTLEMVILPARTLRGSARSPGFLVKRPFAIRDCFESGRRPLGRDPNQARPLRLFSS